MQVETVLERIDGVVNLINEKFDENKTAHTAIQTRVDLTNGRVKKLELWKAYLVGAWAVCSLLLIGILIPLLNNYLKILLQ